MKHSITLYRHARPLVLEVDPTKTLWTNSQPHNGTLQGQPFVEAVRDALLHPVSDFPPLTAALVGDDAIAIVVEADVPLPQQAIQGVLDALGPDHGCQITVVVCEDMHADQLAAIRSHLADEIEVVVHSSQRRDDLRYLAANASADPIYLNRYIVDADVVVPIVVARCGDPLYQGLDASPVFPEFSDDGSQRRVRRDAKQILKLRRRAKPNVPEHEIQAVDHLVGMYWTVCVHVADNGQPYDVHVGVGGGEHCSTVQQQDADAAPEADLVIAQVSGGKCQQSLPNLLRAAIIAGQYVSEDGTVVLVCDLNQLGSVHAGQDWTDDSLDQESNLANELEEGSDDRFDSDTQLQLHLSLQTHSLRVLHDLINHFDNSRRYLLLSDCASDEVEAFGFGSIDNDQSILKLIQASDSCTVLYQAPYAALRDE